VTFTVKGDPWPVITAWAKRHSFKPRELPGATEKTKLFQKGTGLFTSPMRAQFTQTGNTVELQAWVHNLLLSRILTLFLLPMEMNIRSGGLRAVVPRTMARRAVNELLREVNATEIA